MNVLKQFTENLKKRVPVLEDVAEEVAGEIYAAFTETAMQYAADPATPAIVRAVVPAAVQLFDDAVKKAIDGIDGEVG